MEFVTGATERAAVFGACRSADAVRFAFLPKPRRDPKRTASALRQAPHRCLNETARILYRHLRHGTRSHWLTFAAATVPVAGSAEGAGAAGVAAGRFRFGRWVLPVR